MTHRDAERSHKDSNDKHTSTRLSDLQHRLHKSQSLLHLAEQQPPPITAKDEQLLHSLKRQVRHLKQDVDVELDYLKYKADKRHKHSSRRDAEKRTVPLPDGIQPLTADDYYLQALPFRLWLHKDQNQHLDQISSEKARSEFARFVRRWNDGRLSSEIYSAGRADAKVTAKELQSMTSHKWRFAQTAQEELLPMNANAQTPATNPARPARSADVDEAADRRQREYKAEKRRRDELLDEVAPKPVGREAQIEKKRMQRQSQREYQSQRSDPLAAISESTVMGGGGTTEYKAMLAKKQAADARRQEEVNNKATAYRSKENEKMQAMLQSIGRGDLMG